jgi:hypothetical protein
VLKCGACYGNYGYGAGMIRHPSAISEQGGGMGNTREGNRVRVVPSGTPPPRNAWGVITERRFCSVDISGIDKSERAWK